MKNLKKWDEESLLVGDQRGLRAAASAMDKSAGEICK